MRKNIRRSFVVAAAASGIWALGTAGAGAAELPVSSDAVTGTVEKTGKGDPADELGDATRTVRKTTADVARCVTEKLPSKGIPENGLPTNTLPTGDLLKGDLPTDRVGGAVEDAAGRQGKVTGTTGYAAKAVKEARKDIRSATRELPATTAVGAVPGIEVPQVRPSSLPAPALTAVPQVPHLPTVPSAPATGDLVGGLAGASLRPEQLTGVLLADHAQRTLGRVRTAAATAQPFIDRANAAVLPPFAGELVVQVEVVADQGATDTAVTVDDAAATSAPFTESTSVRATTLAQNVTGDLGDFGHGAHADAVPYAHDLGKGLRRNTEGLAFHVVSGVRVITVPSTRDLTDAANIPVLPAASRLPAVPAA